MMITQNETHEDSRNPSASTNITSDLQGKAVEQQTKLLFSPGQIVSTPGALEAMSMIQCLPMDLLFRHLTGDWGSIPAEDAKANQTALENGWRIMSSYVLGNDIKIWLITEADRSVTTFLLPEEY